MELYDFKQIYKPVNEIKSDLFESLLLEYNRKDLKKWAGDEYTQKFLALRNRLQAPENDLGYWIKNDDLEAFKAMIDGWESGAIKSKTQKAKEEKIAGAELLLDKLGWKVYHITTYDAAKKLGSGTTWCITGRYGNYSDGSGFFKNYIDSYNLDGYYFIYDTEHRDKNTGDYLKYCAGIQKGSRKLIFLYNGMQDDEISSRGIPFTEPERQIQLIQGTDIPFSNEVKIEDGVLVKLAYNEHLDEYIFPDEVVSMRSMAGSPQENGRGRNPISFVNTTNCKELGYGAFMGAKIGSIKSNADVIGKGAFLNCDNLRAVTLTGNVKEIPENCFAFCERLHRVILPACVESIADNAFTGCDSSLTIISDSEAVKKYLETHSGEDNWMSDDDDFDENDPFMFNDDEDDDDIVPLF